MNPVDARIRKVLDRLLERSRKDEVLWRDVGTPDYDGYAVDLLSKDERKLQVGLRYWSPDAQPDSAEVSIVFDGREVFHDEALDGTEQFDFYKALYEEARRAVVGWDAALDILEAEVDRPGTIGVKAASTVDSFDM